jgi:hypothetical protein
MGVSREKTPAHICELPAKLTPKYGVAGFDGAYYERA